MSLSAKDCDIYLASYFPEKERETVNSLAKSGRARCTYFCLLVYSYTGYKF